MADKWLVAGGTGNVNDPASWNDGTLPADGDDCYADGFTGQINVDFNIGTGKVSTQQRSGGTAGGGWVLAAGVTLRANVQSGTTTCVTRSAAGAESFIVGTSTGGSGTNTDGILVSAGTVTLTGKPTGGSGITSHGVRCSSGTVNIIGDPTGGTGAGGANTSNYGCSAENGTINITGNPTGSGGVSCHGANSQGTTLSIINVTGNIIGGTIATAYGVRIVQNGTVRITGNITEGTGLAIFSVVSGGLVGNVILNGTGTQTYTQAAAGNIGNLTIAKASGKVVFDTAWTCTNETITGPARIEQSGDRTNTVTGNFAANGTAANPVIWLGPNLIITGTATGVHCYAAGSDATGGTIVSCTNSNGDNSPGWWFQMPSSADIEAITGDTGVPLTKAVEMIAALATGKVTKAIVGSDTVLTYYKRDGTTVSFVVTADSTDATRAAAGSLS